ncbi:MAG: cbb3-type cytochrome c oxidase subunit I, partial [Alphaproteobacteria bacterium]|nr:cbb3-type cytochrome c oxidase subunit I [Alphaproteobacteria bacterium]
MKRAPEQILLRAWMSLGVLALALAGVMAVLLALSRIPGIQATFPWPLAFFERGLVAHVVFSFVVWFLAATGVLVILVRPPQGPAFADRAAAGMAALSFVLLLIPSLSSRGEPTLNNYIPAITDPIYYAGLALLFAALLLAIARFFARLDPRAGFDPAAWTLAAGGGVFLLALAAFAKTYAAIGTEPPSFDFNETLFWGGGHILQFLNVSILIAAWILLAGAPENKRALMLFAALWPLIGALAGAVAEMILLPRAEERWPFFTWLQYALAPAPLAALFALRGVLLSGWRDALKGDVARLTFLLSVVVFAAGGILGLFVDGADTRTPAHYHGVIGGINLALMGIFLARALPRAGAAPKPGRALAWQVWLYGVGQLIACLGLFWAGGYGAPRKTAGAA